MTPEQRAANIMDEACLGERWIVNGVDAALRRSIAAAIRDAVAAERAACTPAVEDIARAWASIDGKRDEFDASKERDADEEGFGCYGGYMFEAEELLKRAEKYAEKRRASK